MSDVVYRSLVNFRFKVELVEGHVYEEYPEVVMRPKYGIKMSSSGDPQSVKCIYTKKICSYLCNKLHSLNQEFKEDLTNLYITSNFKYVINNFSVNSFFWYHNRRIFKTETNPDLHRSIKI